jgi:integrase
MSLTDAKIRNTKPDDKSVKLTDANGLYLEVRPTGAKLWRYRYRIDGKENVFAIGEYFADKRTGHVSLEDARGARDKARQLVKQGIHPSHQRQSERLARTSENANTFKAIAKEWIDKKKGNWSPYYLKQVEHGMDADIYPEIGNLPMRQITAAHVLKILNKVCDRGAETVAINLRQWCSSVFRYAVSTLRADYDPVSALRDAIVRPPVENAKPMTRDQLKVFLEKLGNYGGMRTTTLAIKFMLYTFVRTVEMRRGEWSEVKFDDALWVIPGEKMKKNRVHMVPLSRQALAILRELHKITGAGDHLFPNSRRPADIMSGTTINRAMEYLGIPFSGHDFRATASTHLYEMGYDEKLVEMQLAHAETKKTKAAYNHAQYLPERRAMMQRWADWIDDIAASENSVAEN